MYSENIRQRLEQENIEEGDLVRVNGVEGKLMPKPESGDSDFLVLKLDSGYNIGLKPGSLEKLGSSQSFGSNASEGVSYDDSKDDILILHTGGTIASKVSYQKGGVEPAFDPQEIIDMYPEAAEEVNLHSEVVAQMYSGDMEPGHWKEIASKVHERKDQYDGILIGHGTDTMAYTGSALSLALKGIDTGVLLVGAQRSSDRPSSDSAMNLYCASKFLSQTDYEGIGLCMHKSIEDNKCVVLPASKARKMHTSRRDTFEPINASSQAVIDYPSGTITSDFENTDEEYQYRPEFEEDVRIIKSRPGFKLDELDFLIEKDPAGLIIEGTGLGHAPVNDFDDHTDHHDEILDRIDKLADDAAVAVASQCIHGRTNMNVYQYGLKLLDAGAIESEDMHPELAYVKMMWSLGNADNLEDAKKLFTQNVAGEITPRSKLP